MRAYKQHGRPARHQHGNHSLIAPESTRERQTTTKKSPILPTPKMAPVLASKLAQNRKWLFLLAHLPTAFRLAFGCPGGNSFFFFFFPWSFIWEVPVSRAGFETCPGWKTRMSDTWSSIQAHKKQLDSLRERLQRRRKQDSGHLGEARVTVCF